MPQLILASTSPYRKQLLSRLGWSFTAVSPPADEASISEGSPLEIAQARAHLKAQSLVSEHPEACIIGGDQLASLDGDILGKPGNIDKAVAQLLKLQGKTHQLFTAVTILFQGKEHSFVNTTSLTMRPLSKQQLQNYVEKDHPLDCAGAYKLEKSGIALFEKIDSEDASAIEGLPLIKLTSHLLEFGFSL